jgi:hypothetical protein
MDQSEREVVVPKSKFGEICAAYSADKLTQNEIRKPFMYEGKLFVTVGMLRDRYAKAYQVVPESEFDGRAEWYEGHYGFSYHGQKAKLGKELVVLQRPCIKFKPSADKEPEQLALELR